MRAMTKSAVRLASEALLVGRRTFPRYSCPRSRHDFTQAQLFAVLILRQFLQTDYRGVVTLLAEWSEVRQTLGLRKVPHYSTLCYAERRLLADAEKGAPFGAPSTSSSRARSAPASSRRPRPPASPAIDCWPTRKEGRLSAPPARRRRARDPRRPRRAGPGRRDRRHGVRSAARQPPLPHPARARRPTAHPPAPGVAEAHDGRPHPLASDPRGRARDGAHQRLD